MHRRAVEIDRDYDQLLAMQMVSWEINFPGREFHEGFFQASLAVAARQGNVYVYEIDGTIVGWLWLDWSDRRTCHIRHLQVQRSHWGQGLGRALLQDAIQLSSTRERKALTLSVTKSNERAMTLYRNTGFVLEEDQGDRQRMRLKLPRR